MTVPSHITIGGLSIYFYSLFIVLGIALGYLLARPEAKRFKIDGETLFVSIFYGVLPALVGARLYHVIDQWGSYAADPLAILNTTHGGLGILGALAGGALGLWFYSRRYQIPFLRVLDIWAPSVLLGQAIGRFGNWTNQEAFGPPTDAPWGIPIDYNQRPAVYLNETHFHPTFFYEAGFDFLGLALLLWVRPSLRRQPGAVFGAYLVIYGLGRFLVEFFRFDTAHIAGIAVAHVVAIALVVLGIYLLTRGGTGSSRQSRSSR